jgi:hypothetical protein
VGKVAIRFRAAALGIADVSDYIGSFYDRIRRHCQVGGVSPEVFETTAKRA